MRHIAAFLIVALCGPSAMAQNVGGLSAERLAPQRFNLRDLGAQNFDLRALDSQALEALNRNRLNRDILRIDRPGSNVPELPDLTIPLQAEALKGHQDVLEFVEGLSPGAMQDFIQRRDFGDLIFVRTVDPDGTRPTFGDNDPRAGVEFETHIPLSGIEVGNRFPLTAIAPAPFLTADELLFREIVLGTPDIDSQLGRPFFADQFNVRQVGDEFLLVVRGSPIDIDKLSGVSREQIIRDLGGQEQSVVWPDGQVLQMLIVAGDGGTVDAACNSGVLASVSDYCNLSAVELRVGGHTQCSGTLIASDRVLTAAHCVCDLVGSPWVTGHRLDTDAWSVTLGLNHNTPHSTDLQVRGDYVLMNGTVPLGVGNTHPVQCANHTSGITEGDLALIALQSPVSATETAAIGLPELDPQDLIAGVGEAPWSTMLADTTDQAPPSRQLFAWTYGQSLELFDGFPFSISGRKVGGRFTLLDEHVNAEPGVAEVQVGSLENTASFCPSDSGGGLFKRVSDGLSFSWAAIAVVSRTTGRDCFFLGQVVEEFSPTVAIRLDTPQVAAFLSSDMPMDLSGGSSGPFSAPTVLAEGDLVDGITTLVADNN